MDIGIPLADPGRNYIFVYDGATERAFVHPSEKAEGFLYALDTP